jgi:GNAT superfamily N-acetyltransferase
MTTKHPMTTFYLEMLSPDGLACKACAEPDFWIGECGVKQFQYNRFLYQLVGSDWKWFDKRSWTDEDWRAYAEAENLRTWVGYWGGAPAGYYELKKQEEGNVEIAYFGLARPFIAKGLGGHLLSHAIQSAWGWGATRVWVHTCTLDHPHALKNYLARGMKIYKEITSNNGNMP